MLGTTYFKRFRMEIVLDAIPPVPELPGQCFWVPWQESVLNLHAEVHYLAFHESMDADLFPSFRDRAGCWYLLREIRDKPGFLADATWLIACPEGLCATIQSIDTGGGVGSIQNVGVAPAYRQRGLGAALVLQALHGFVGRRFQRVYLDVTAENEPAVRLYERLGFRKMNTSFKAVYPFA
jgi:GNAT superfamily N-acetyltransferase